MHKRGYNICIKDKKRDDIMSKSEEIMKIARQNNGIVTSLEVDELGIHRQYLTELVKKGKLERAERGVYISVDVFEDTLFILQTRFKKGVYSHNTALYLHGLTDRTPLKHTMTFPTAYNITNVQNHNIKTHRASEKFYKVGIVETYTNHNNKVRVYSVEKTLCDIVRGHCKMSKEEVVNAFKEYSKRKNKDLNALFKYAKLLKVEKIIRRYMEVLA